MNAGVPWKLGPASDADASAENNLRAQIKTQPAWIAKGERRAKEIEQEFAGKKVVDLLPPAAPLNAPAPALPPAMTLPPATNPPPPEVTRPSLDLKPPPPPKPTLSDLPVPK